MYHIIYDLERKFASLEDCRKEIKNLVLKPHIPFRAMFGEDTATPRVCVGETIEDCVTAIGVEEVFARCFQEKDFDLPLQKTTEVYPIIVVELSNDLKYQTPTEEVPDVCATKEKWLLEAATPVRAEVVWLDAFSVEAYFDFEFGCHICNRIYPVDDIKEYNHPWLNRRGRPLMGDRWDTLCKCSQCVL